MICKNCESNFDSKFCPNCGQKADIHRITVRYVFHDFVHALTHADKGFILLVKRLFTKPGLVAREYIEGKRKRYFNPLSFLVITAAIHAYISLKTGYFSSQNSSQGGGRRMPAIWVEVFQISNTNGKLLTLILIAPLMAVLSWLFFRRTKHTVAETFVLNSLVVGQAHVMRTLIFIPAFLLWPQGANWNLLVFELMFLTYIIVAYKQFFNQNLFLTIMKSALTLVLFILSYWLFIFGYVYIKHLFVGNG